MESGSPHPKNRDLDYLLDFKFGTRNYWHRTIKDEKSSANWLFYFRRYDIMKLTFSRGEQVIIFQYFSLEIRLNDTEITFLRRKLDFLTQNCIPCILQRFLTKIKVFISPVFLAISFEKYLEHPWFTNFSKILSQYKQKAKEITKSGSPNQKGFQSGS